ncbi:DUF6301 family protein [Nocardia sp. NPDC051030]|uniref:DUF6301 family protein n=1 Tax=Nocardia sp. NPDC051030 TaxID=3155162 RepID=UPI0034360F80
MRDDLRVDLAGAIELAGVATGFDWTWDIADIQKFADAAGWSGLEPGTDMGQGGWFASTGLDVWQGSAMFWCGDERLAYVRVALSSPAYEHDPETPDTVRAAFDTAVAEFHRVWGDPVQATAGPEQGPCWAFPNLFAGVVVGPQTVDLMLISPAEQQYWTEKNARRTAWNTELSAWELFTDSLAAFLDGYRAEGTKLIISAPGNRYAQFAFDDGGLYAELAAAEFIEDDYRYGPQVEAALIADGWMWPEPDRNWSRQLSKPVNTFGYNELAGIVVFGLQALGIETPDELLADAWIDGSADTVDLSGLGIPPHPNIGPRRDRQRAASGIRIESDPEDDLAVDVPGAIRIVTAAMAFEWTWTEADAERFAADVGWAHDGDLYKQSLLRMRTDLEIDDPQATYWFEGETLRRVEFAVSDNVGHLDPGEENTYEEELVRIAYDSVLEGLREVWGAPVGYGTAGSGSGAVWEFPGFALRVEKSGESVEMNLLGPAERKRGVTNDRNHIAHRAQARGWDQLVEDLSFLLAEDLSVGATLIVGAEGNKYARITREPKGLHGELGDRIADPLWRFGSSTEKYMIKWGFTPPDDERPNWRIDLALPATLRDCREFARLLVWGVRTHGGPLAEVTVRGEGLDLSAFER